MLSPVRQEGKEGSREEEGRKENERKVRSGENKNQPEVSDEGKNIPF